MNNSLCHQLDDYLAGELNELARREFTEHLERCEACRGEVGVAEQINTLLATAEIAVPPMLAGRIDRRIRTARLRRLAAYAGLSAAVLCVCLAGWLLFFDRSDEKPPEFARRPPSMPSESPREPEPPEVIEAEQQVRVTFDSSNVIGMPLKSENPGVSIYWIYPTISTAQSDSNNTPSTP